MIWLTVLVRQSPIHWFGGLTIYVEALWRTTNGLRVGGLVMDRGGSDVALDYPRACQDRSSRLEQGAGSLESSSIGLRSARACSCATLRRISLESSPIISKMDVSPATDLRQLSETLA